MDSAWSATTRALDQHRARNSRYGNHSDRRRESRHEPEVGRRQGRPGDGAPRRADACRPGQDPGARWLQRPPGHLRAPRRQETEQAGRRALRQGVRRPGQAAHRAAPRVGRRLRGRPGDPGRRPRRRLEGRRHRRQQGQGLRRNDEAPQLQGPGRQPRQPQAPPGPRLGRRRLVPGPRVQGHQDVRPHGPRAGDHAEPGSRRVRRRAQPAARQGLGARSPRRRGRRPQRSQVGREGRERSS